MRVAPLGFFKLPSTAWLVEGWLFVIPSRSHIRKRGTPAGLTEAFMLSGICGVIYVIRQFVLLKTRLNIS